jgi:hypothetical protein
VNEACAILPDEMRPSMRALPRFVVLDALVRLARRDERCRMWLAGRWTFYSTRLDMRQAPHKAQTPLTTKGQ